MLDYDLQYSDLLSFCPQWQDIFVKRVLEFRPAAEAPRILDCGANVGLATLYFKRAFPHARVSAFEADPAIFALLKSNLETNGAADVDCTHAALWTSNGTLTFQCEGSDSGMIGDLSGAITGRSTVVPSLRLRDLLTRERVDLLKLDIEGAEDAVLRDCADVLVNVKAMIMDLHEFDPGMRQAPRVLELLSMLGFAYVVDDFVALPWRQPLTPVESPFPGRPTNWAMTVRAWRKA